MRVMPTPETSLFEGLHDLRERIDQLEQETSAAREQLRAAEHRFQMLADADPVMIWLTGPDGACVFVGKPLARFSRSLRRSGTGQR